MNTESNYSPISQADIQSSYNTLSKAIKSDESYAWAWHCTIAMAIIDRSLLPHTEANAAAASVMQALFDVDTKQNRHWDSIFSEATAQTSNTDSEPSS
jgi:hypothetical protein